jgi:hypothetical protein
VTASLLTWLDANWLNAIAGWTALSFTLLAVWVVLCESTRRARRRRRRPSPLELDLIGKERIGIDHPRRHR